MSVLHMNSSVYEFLRYNCFLPLTSEFWRPLLNKQDIWQGTQLLAIDAGAAMGLLRRMLRRDELTEKEKKTLKRTLTDMASVIPIGVLMLLPVSCACFKALSWAKYVSGIWEWFRARK